MIDLRRVGEYLSQTEDEFTNSLQKSEGFSPAEAMKISTEISCWVLQTQQEIAASSDMPVLAISQRAEPPASLAQFPSIEAEAGNPKGIFFWFPKQRPRNSLLRNAAAAAVLFIVLLGTGAVARNSMVKYERDRMEILRARLLAMSHSVEDDVDSLGEIQAMLHQLEMGKAVFSENKDLWSMIQLGFTSQLAIEQSKKGSFDSAIEMARAAALASSQIEDDAGIPLQSITHFALAKSQFDYGCSLTGEPRMLMLEEALDSIRIAIKSDQRAGIGEAVANDNLIYSARLLGLEGVILHKLNMADENPLDSYAVAFDYLDAVSPAGRGVSYAKVRARMLADKSLTLIRQREFEAVDEVIQDGIDLLESTPAADGNTSEWQLGLLYTSWADSYADRQEWQLEVEKRSLAVEHYLRASRVQGSFRAIHENIVLSFCRLAMAYLVMGESEKARVAIHRLQGATDLSFGNYRMGEGDIARTAILLADDPTISDEKKKAYLALAREKFLIYRENQKRFPPDELGWGLEEKRWNLILKEIGLADGELRQWIEEFVANRP